MKARLPALSNNQKKKARAEIEKMADAVKAKNGIPHICCAKLGLVEYCGELFSMDCERCKSCWNTPAKESEE